MKFPPNGIARCLIGGLPVQLWGMLECSCTYSTLRYMYIYIIPDVRTNYHQDEPAFEPDSRRLPYPSGLPYLFS